MLRVVWWRVSSEVFVDERVKEGERGNEPAGGEGGGGEEREREGGAGEEGEEKALQRRATGSERGPR